MLRQSLVFIACLMALGACDRLRRPTALAAPVAPLPLPNPFDDVSASFLVSGPRFTTGGPATKSSLFLVITFQCEKAA